MNKYWRIALSMAAVLTLAVGVAGCRSKAEKKKPVVGVTLLTNAHDFFKDLTGGLQSEADRRGLELIINYAEFDVIKQIEQIEAFVARGVDAIVVAPADSAGIEKGIVAANQAGIPVFTTDIATFGGEYVSHIASDNIMGGRLAGEYLAQAMGGQGLALVIEHAGVSSAMDRVRGFESMMDGYPGITVKKINGGGLREWVRTKLGDFMENDPDAGAVKGIFGINDDSALGALEVLRQVGRDDVVIVGYDAQPEARKEILAGGMLKADVVQFPQKIGERTIAAVADYLSGNHDLLKQDLLSVELWDREALTARGDK